MPLKNLSKPLLPEMELQQIQFSPYGEAIKGFQNMFSGGHLLFLKKSLISHILHHTNYLLRNIDDLVYSPDLLGEEQDVGNPHVRFREGR